LLIKLAKKRKKTTDLKGKIETEKLSTAEMDFKAKMDNFDYAEFIEDTKNEKINRSGGTSGNR
jgi:hypothetical protein